MKKLLAAALLCGLIVAPAFAAKKPKPVHQKFDYRYHTPKYKLPKSHNRRAHLHNDRKAQGQAQSN
jgi:hypothetical protein